MFNLENRQEDEYNTYTDVRFISISVKVSAEKLVYLLQWVALRCWQGSWNQAGIRCRERRQLSEHQYKCLL